MLTINNLSVSYGSYKVLTDLNASMTDGKIYGVVGLNGTGKTTLLNAIYGIPKRQRCICYNNAILTRSDIAFLETNSFFYSRITGRDYLKLFQSHNPSFLFDEMGTVFNLPLDRFVDSYSEGMKKKLALIGALSMDKKILLLDEPYNGLDLESASALQIILRRIASKGVIIIVTSHIMESLAPVCDSIFLLLGGRIEHEYLPYEYVSLSRRIKGDIYSKYNEVIIRAFHG